jgi:integrase
MVRNVRHWVVYEPIGSTRKRHFFTSKVTAEAEASRIQAERDSAGKVWTELPAEHRTELIAIWNEITTAGHTLREVWDAYRRLPQGKVAPALGDVVKELIQVKRNAGRSPDYVGNLELILNQFMNGKAVIPVSQIGLPEVQQFLDSKRINSRSTLRARLSTLFKFSMRREYRADNPCARLEAITVPHEPPRVFTPEQAGSCVQWLRANAKHALPWFILSTFCGLRPEEAEKTTRADIHAKEGWIKVEAQTTKVRQRRIVYPKPEALAMLAKSLKGGSLPLNPTARKRVIQGFGDAEGLRDVIGSATWPKDITRHSAASYWLADSGSAEHIAGMLGHSEKVLNRNYKALVTKEQAKAFWKICT